MRPGQEGSSRQAELARIGYNGCMEAHGQIRAAAAALLLVATSAPVAAETVQTTRYSSYPVSGGSPAEIYRSILKRGPSIDGTKAIAATKAQVVQTHTLQQGTSSCKVTQFRLAFHFNVQLPRLVNASRLTPQDRYLWQQFSSFLKSHELQHTRLWLRCGKELERRVMTIRAGSCEEAQRKADATWQRMKPGCDRQQTSFDTEQRAELMSQPFMQRVIHGN